MATYTTNYNLYEPDGTDAFEDFREKFNDNMDIIDQNMGGGGGGGNVNDVEVNGVSVVDGNKVAKIISYKEVTQAQYDALPSSKLTDGIAYFIKDGGGSGGSGSFLLIINAGTGETVTATKGGTTLTATEVSTGIYEVEITSSGTWTISDGNNTATVDVGVYTTTLSSIPEGSTVTPTDDVSIWLACGGRTENYTTVSEVLADSTCLLALLSDNNANDYLVRSTTWASTITADSSAMSYIGLNNYCANTLLADSTWNTAIQNSPYFESVDNVKVPAMTSATTPEGEVSARGSYGSQVPYMAFDNNTGTAWRSQSLSTSDHITWIQYKFSSKRKIYRAYWYATHSTTDANLPNASIKIQASNDNSTFTDIYSESLGNINNKEFVFTFTCDTEYLYWRLWIDANVRSLQPSVYAMEVQYYGRKDI